MDVQDYCKAMNMELTAWKAKMYDVTRRMDKLGSAEKEKVLGNVEDMHMLVTEMEDRVNQLTRECPAEWSPIKKEIDNAHVDMRGKFEETMAFIGTAAPVSVPG
jgi:phage host-nuclease inhibitor protein Gam